MSYHLSPMELETPKLNMKAGSHVGSHRTMRKITHRYTRQKKGQFGGRDINTNAHTSTIYLPKLSNFFASNNNITRNDGSVSNARSIVNYRMQNAGKGNRIVTRRKKRVTRGSVKHYKRIRNSR